MLMCVKVLSEKCGKMKGVLTSGRDDKLCVRSPYGEGLTEGQKNIFLFSSVRKGMLK